ncbi:MAG: hypothetical protein ACE5LU_11855 [Anaerolineae bacterium]
MYELLLRVFKNLEDADIRYCLMRPHEELGRLADGGDVDLLVEKSQLAQLRGRLSQLGFVNLSSRGYAPHHFFVTYDEGTDLWLKLDVVTEVAYGRPIHSLRTALAANCLNNRRRCGPTFIPSPEDELVTLLLHCILDKGDFAPARRRRLKVLQQEVTDERYLSTLLATYWPPVMSWPVLAAMIDTENWEALLAARSAIAAHLAGSDRLRVLGREVYDRLLRKLNRWAGIWQPRAPTVALLAPDGAGKSTLAAGIQDSFYLPVRSVYMGLYQDGAARRPRSPIPGLGLAGRLLTQWWRYFTARYHQARGRLVVFDRYTYDALLAPRQPVDWLRRLRRWLLAHTCPAPDLVLVLDAPGEVLYARKGEHSAAVLEQQRRRFLELQPRLSQMVVVDATHDAEHVRRRVTSLIWHGYAGCLGEISG